MTYKIETYKSLISGIVIRGVIGFFIGISFKIIMV
jgi:hypothetical protein